MSRIQFILVEGAQLNLITEGRRNNFQVNPGIHQHAVCQLPSPWEKRGGRVADLRDLHELIEEVLSSPYRHSH